MRNCISCGTPIDMRGHTGLCRQCWQRSISFDLKPHEAAYIAGLFDGEAHIAISRQLPTARSRRVTPAYKVLVEISMTEKQPLEYINNLLPDAKIIHQMTKGHRLPYYRLRIIQRQAMRLLELIYPYLKAKKIQVELCMKFEALRKHYLISANLYPKGQSGKARAPDEFIRKAEDIYWELRANHLNKKPRSKRAVERFI